MRQLEAQRTSDLQRTQAHLVGQDGRVLAPPVAACGQSVSLVEGRARLNAQVAKVETVELEGEELVRDEPRLLFERLEAGLGPLAVELRDRPRIGLGHDKLAEAEEAIKSGDEGSEVGRVALELGRPCSCCAFSAADRLGVDRVDVPCSSGMSCQTM